MSAGADARRLSAERLPIIRSGVFAGGRETPSARLEAGDLPDHSRGSSDWPFYEVLLTLLPERRRRGALRDVIRRVRNQGVVARSYLSTSAALDFHAILIGPRGSEGVDRWRALA